MWYFSGQPTAGALSPQGAVLEAEQWAVTGVSKWILLDVLGGWKRQETEND